MSIDKKNLHKRKWILTVEYKMTMCYILGIATGAIVNLLSIIIMFLVLEIEIY